MTTNESPEENILLNASDNTSTEKASPPYSKLKYHYAAIWLIGLYIPFVIIPWTATVVLSYRPIAKFANTYYYPPGFTTDEFKHLQSWVTAVNVLNSIASLLAVPVVSFVIAQTAVVFSQQKTPTRQLSVRDVFALADRAWTDVSVLFKLLRAKGHGSRAFNGFVALASTLLLFSALQPPLYQVLVNWKNINVPSGLLGEINIRHPSPNTEISTPVLDTIPLGTDADPAIMEMIPHATVVQNVQLELPSMRWSAPETYMWIDFNGTQPPNNQLPNQQGDGVNSLLNIRMGEKPRGQQILPAFISAFPYNTTTGTKRYHVMRLNSSVECEFLSKDTFPATCSGSKPYETSITMQNETSSTELRVCIPGVWGTSPWTRSRNRQDTKEEVFLQLLGGSNQNDSIIHCSAATTRGYFELGNYRINGAYGRLLDHWPSPEIIERDFNDKGSHCVKEESPELGCRPESYYPTEWDNKTDKVESWNASAEPEYMRWNASGPLVTSAAAIFGNNSWIRVVANLTSTQTNSSDSYTSMPPWWKPICERQPLYHSSFGVRSCEDLTPSEAVGRWLTYSFDPESMERLLFSSMVLANKAILLIHRNNEAPRKLWEIQGRAIEYSPGFSILKPDVSLASIIVISIILAIQIFGLVLCGIYIARVPTWTRSFNAMAIARIGSGLAKDHLPIDGQYAEDEDYQRLRTAGIPLSMASANAIVCRRKKGSQVKK
ncbi:unnamed protein product [Periconia digitata]|uniref:Uncharacterized protein n=1 Tax=Periconia digitata TaxID=1303443 RepID=A0A9W4UDA0_9PLEO|nr:unnamed protein product [Periconia digitata]